MKTRFLLPLVLIFALFASFAVSCESRGRDVFAFADSDALFTLTFEGEAGEVVCECERAGERITATVISPERSRGIAITVGEGGVYLTAGSAEIPLSEDAARGFTAIFDVMFRGSEGAEVRMSANGEFTEAVYEDGVLTIDGEGRPVAADVGRVVKISNYKAKE
jgi:hypothetical protein